MGPDVYRAMVQMVSSSLVVGGELVPGQFILFESRSFSADDSVWHPSAPVKDVALPACGSMHFRISCWAFGFTRKFGLGNPGKKYFWF